MNRPALYAPVWFKVRIDGGGVAPVPRWSALMADYYHRRGVIDKRAFCSERTPDSPLRDAEKWSRVTQGRLTEYSWCQREVAVPNVNFCVTIKPLISSPGTLLVSTAVGSYVQSEKTSSVFNAIRFSRFLYSASACNVSQVSGFSAVLVHLFLKGEK